jgi:hypothetical protein
MTTGAEGKEQDQLDQFIKSVDDLPDDPDAIVAAIESMKEPDDAAKQTEQKAEPKDEPKAKAEEEAKAKAEEDSKAKAEEKPEAKPEDERPVGVLLKDGKTVIPYAALEAERRRADEERRAKEAAEAARRQAEERIKALTAEVEAMRQGKNLDGSQASKEDEGNLRSRLAELKETVPEIAEVMDALITRLDKNDEELRALRAREEERLEREREEARRLVQEAIDRNPKLLYIQAERPDLYAEAVREDKLLRESNSPIVQQMTLDERFAKVIERLEMIHGPIELPEKYKVAAKKEPAPEKNKPDVKQREPSVKGPEPTTLSHLPGGVPPGTRKRVEDMTSAEADAFIQAQLDKGKNPLDILAALEALGE